MEEAACSSARRPQPAAREGGLEGPAASAAEGMEEAPSSAFMPGCPCSLLGTKGDTVSLSLNRQRSHRGGFVPTIKLLGVAEPGQQRWKAARGALGCGCPFLCPSEPGQRTPKTSNGFGTEPLPRRCPVISALYLRDVGERGTEGLHVSPTLFPLSLLDLFPFLESIALRDLLSPTSLNFAVLAVSSSKPGSSGGSASWPPPPA